METNAFFSSNFFQTHQKTTAVRSGDYYLFEDLDEKVELDLLHERPSAGIDDAITDRKLSDKMTIEQVNFFNKANGSGHPNYTLSYNKKNFHQK